MNRRGFLGTCASLLPLPAFVKATSLWLPPERLRIVEPVDFVPDGPVINFQCGVIREAFMKAIEEHWKLVESLSGITYQSALKDRVP
jgi:hypothetical protein